MKAAVLNRFGEAPVYQDFPDPQPEPHQALMQVKAASIKNIDRGRAAGTHYDSYGKLPAVVGIDGVGVLEDGRRVYAMFSDGMIAEKAAVDLRCCIPLPGGIDDVTAAALPNPGLSAWFALYYRAAIQPGDKVLIMGATGVTGRMAIQLAKYFGAGRIVAAGRNAAMLTQLPALGADAVISLAQTEEQIAAVIQQEAAAGAFDIVIDYVWGRPAELLLDAISGHDLNAAAHRTRYVQVGQMAGAAINLKAGILRATAIELYGVGGGSVPKEVMEKVPTEILPRLISLVADGTIKIETEAVPLAAVEAAWKRGDRDGKRTVVVM